jgi:hypothetical protein
MGSYLPGPANGYPTSGSPYDPTRVGNTSDPGNGDFSNLPSGDPNVLQTMAISNTLGQGQQLIGGDTSQENYYGGLEQQGYQNFTNLYNPIWQGGGGYTPGETSGILQAGGTTGTNALQFEASGATNAQNFLTPGEQSSIVGDPMMAYRTAQGYGTGIDQTLSESANAENAPLASGAATLTGDVSTMAQGYGNAIDPSQLSASQGYFNSQGAALGQGAAATSSALANPALNPTSTYLQQASMSDQQVQQAAEEGATAAGAGYQSDIDSLKASAAASGTVNPLAVASMENQLRQQQGAAVVDASVNAQLQAEAAQRQAATGIQQTQLNAGQYQTSAELTAAQQQEQQQLGASQEQEATRLGAAQNLSGEEMTAAGNVGLAAIGAGEFGQGQAEQTQQAIAGQELAGGEFVAGQGVATAQAGEQAQEAAQNEIAQNRQQTQEYNQNQQFQNSMALNNTMSNRYTNVANQYQQQQAEGRQAATGNMQYQGSQANAAGTRANTAYGTETSGLGSQTASYNQNKTTQQNNSFFGSNGLFGKLTGNANNVANAASGWAKGGILSEPTHLTMSDGSDAIAGEAPDSRFPSGHAPEAILPLTDPNYEPMMEKIRRVRAQIKSMPKAA